MDTNIVTYTTNLLFSFPCFFSLILIDILRTYSNTFNRHQIKKGYRTIPVLYVNGKKIPKNKACQARPNQTLLSFLRDVLNLTGSKLGCAEGGCGACTVMISRLDDNVDGEQKIKHYSVNACLMPILSADGCHVTTVEGIGTVKGDSIHPVQQAMVDMHGSQCGKCYQRLLKFTYVAHHTTF